MNIINLVSLIKPALAQDSVVLKPQGSTFINLTNLTFSGIVSGLISLALLITALVFFFILLLGGIKWITANGDEKALGTARTQITNALIGLAIVFAAWAILKIIEILFGITILNGIVIPSFQSQALNPQSI